MAKGKSGFRKAPPKKATSPEANEFIGGALEARQEADQASPESVSSAQEQLELARKALSLILTLEELKGFTGQVEAIRFYARQAEELLGLENRSAQIRLRAERRAGQLLADLFERAKDAQSTDAGKELPSLDTLGITESQFRRFRELEAIPDKLLEQEVAPPETEPERDASKTSERGLVRQPSPDAVQQSDVEMMDDEFRAAIEAMVTAIKTADENNWKTTSKETALRYVEMLRHMIVIDEWQ